jgi:hypothetical protein
VVAQFLALIAATGGESNFIRAVVIKKLQLFSNRFSYDFVTPIGD